jgi:hypothetical protein
MTPSRLLSLARITAGTTPPALLLTVTGGEFGFATALSPAVAAALPGAARAARAALVAFSGTPSRSTAARSRA